MIDWFLLVLLALAYFFGMWIYGLIRVGQQKECQHKWKFYRSCEYCGIEQRGEEDDGRNKN